MRNKRFSGKGNRGRGVNSIKGAGDWEVALTPANVAMWSSLTNFANGARQDFDIQAIVPAQPNTYGVVPPLGLIQVNELDCSFEFMPPVTSISTIGYFQVGVGMYIAEYDTDNMSFSTQDPLLANDVCRDNWLYLQTYTYQFPGTSVLSVPWSIKTKIPSRRVRIDEGKALRISVKFNSGAGGSPSMDCWRYLRSKIVRVA